MSSDECINPLLRLALIDRMDPWELIEFLEIPMEVLLDIFENEIVDNTDELEELMGITIDYTDE